MFLPQACRGHRVCVSLLYFTMCTVWCRRQYIIEYSCGCLVPLPQMMPTYAIIWRPSSHCTMCYSYKPFASLLNRVRPGGTTICDGTEHSSSPARRQHEIVWGVVKMGDDHLLLYVKLMQSLLECGHRAMWNHKLCYARMLRV